MTGSRKLLGVLLALGVAGCAGYGSNASPGPSPSILDAVNAGCAEYAAVAVPLSTAPSARVQNILAYGNGLCDVATGKIKPGLAAQPSSPALDPTTAAWIGAITGTLKAAAALALAPTIWIWPTKPA